MTHLTDGTNINLGEFPMNIEYGVQFIRPVWYRRLWQFLNTDLRLIWYYSIRPKFRR